MAAPKLIFTVVSPAKEKWTFGPVDMDLKSSEEAFANWGVSTEIPPPIMVRLFFKLVLSTEPPESGETKRASDQGWELEITGS